MGWDHDEGGGLGTNMATNQILEHHYVWHVLYKKKIQKQGGKSKTGAWGPTGSTHGGAYKNTEQFQLSPFTVISVLHTCSQNTHTHTLAKLTVLILVKMDL